MNFHPRRKQDDGARATPRMGSTGRWFALVDPERQREVPAEIEVRRAQQQAVPAAPVPKGEPERRLAD